MKIKLTTKQMEWCQELAIKRSGSKNHAETKNSINCFKDKKGWHRHYVGVLGGSISRNKFDQFKQIKNFGYGDSYVVSKTHLNKII